jgi:hypothetical protein
VIGDDQPDPERRDPISLVYGAFVRGSWVSLAPSVAATTLLLGSDVDVLDGRASELKFRRISSSRLDNACYTFSHSGRSEQSFVHEA